MYKTIDVMEKVIAKVEREVGERNFSCYMNVKSVRAGVLGQGNSAREAMADMLQGWEDTKDDLRACGIEVPPIDIKYKFDIGALFNYYDFINVASGDMMRRNRPTSSSHIPFPYSKPCRKFAIKESYF